VPADRQVTTYSNNCAQNKDEQDTTIAIWFRASYIHPPSFEAQPELPYRISIDLEGVLSLRGNVSLELEQEVICRHDRLQVGSKVVVHHGVVPSCAFQSQFDHSWLRCCRQFMWTTFACAVTV